ncbi:MAG TPA: ATP-binding cassette domain-containing protein [Jatrophihabitans sp.]|nr:ATP-binding cassette domain-containing protein [Jatrophihabitans sp.]
MIEARALSKYYGRTKAVDGLTFEVRPGIVTGFLGPNGAGKSTTMRLIMGLDEPSSGTVLVNGRRYAALRRPLHEVGAVLETGALHGGRSAYNHLLCLAQSNGIGRGRVAEVLELVGLTEVARRRAGAFSLGMRQRLGLAAALLGDPPVLLCDEPVNGLDPEGILWIRTLLRRLAAEGRTVFVSSHLMSEMALTADHLIVVGRGRLVADASTTEIIDRASTKSVVVRTPARGRLREALRAAGADVQSEPDALIVRGLAQESVGDLAARHGIAIHELHTRQPSLEEAFMKLTQDSVDFRTELVGAR